MLDGGSIGDAHSHAERCVGCLALASWAGVVPKAGVASSVCVH
jgi:hypothetical protein